MDSQSKGKFYIIVIVVLLLGALGTSWALKYIKNNYEPAPSPTPVSTTPTPLPPVVTPPNPGTTPPPVTVPATLLLSVPFTSQAPKNNWEGIYAEGCEEASSLMASEYFKGTASTTLDADYVIEQIQKAADWEMENLGYNLDINNSETVRMLKEHFGLNARLVNNFSQDDIKKELAQNHLVLLPAQGQMLGNPNFRRPGPPYHMLVIKGYNSQGIVTNDPGTRNGRNYTYSFDVLYAATGEWQHDTKSVDTSVKQIIVVSK